MREHGIIRRTTRPYYRQKTYNDGIKRQNHH
jgi:hypothetical protein